MRVAPTVFHDAEALGRALAAEIADEIDGAAHDGRRYVLGCPGGRSAHSTYRALADEVAARGLDLGHVVVVMMDEYVEQDRDTAAFRRIDPALRHSCVRFGREEIVQPLDAAAGPGRGIAADHFLVPDPADPGAYDERIAALGGIDLFLLASGSGDGHIAFNPVGTRSDAGTHVVALTEQTRRDNLATFPSLRGLADVPLHGVTVGVGTIREHSRRVVMVAHGTDKAKAVSRLAGADRYQPDWPATVFTDCAQPRLYVDRAALQAAEALTAST
ncbi:6-phosphogluconolactonase [Actinacidiphila yeochonensis]|uniref:6-phosphogluconolactonase n=1 Tax=Actinacidiphila yeochonensis TaxID=89050 RepID=UPI000A4B197C|nr:6-phosphogluconolactonase [Actinacidiphila yeochonensis]